jgi:hypothetical protein
MSLETIRLQYRSFVVGDKPLCLWDADIQQKNMDFLESLDPGYFEYMVKVHQQTITEADNPTDKEAQFAAMALRTIYSQALETLFAIIFTTLQAPHCPPAWFNEYTNKQLHTLINQVNQKEPFLSVWGIDVPSWSSIVEILFLPLDLDDKEQESAVKAGFAKAWEYFALDFLDNGHAQEYNSIKHGLRARPGGFEIKIGIPDEPGTAPPEDKMVFLSRSDFGSNYLVSERSGFPKHHLRLKGALRNWSIENIVSGIELAAVSIENVQSILTFINTQINRTSTISSPCSLKVPDLSCFDRRPDFVNMTSPEVRIPPEWIKPISKEEILADYNSMRFFLSKTE